MLIPFSLYLFALQSLLGIVNMLYEGSKISFASDCKCIFDVLSKPIKLRLTIIILSVKMEHPVEIMHRKWNI